MKPFGQRSNRGPSITNYGQQSTAPLAWHISFTVPKSRTIGAIVRTNITSPRLTARDNWGRGTRKFTRLIFYIRSHWLRMPPHMLMRHLWVKWRKG